MASTHLDNTTNTTTSTLVPSTTATDSTTATYPPVLYPPVVYPPTQIVIEPGPSTRPSPRPSRTSIFTSTDETPGSSVMNDTNSTTLSLSSSPTWTHRVSASFNAMADQIAAASQAISLIPPFPEEAFQQLSTRLEAIEKAQEKLQDEFKALKEKIEQRDSSSPEELKKAIDEQVANFKLEQLRLPARLHNAAITVNKMTIKPLALPNGKFPPQFPATKGEFEHLTKERYEHLMKAYGVPISGDTAAKRETLRVFIGLSQ